MSHPNPRPRPHLRLLRGSSSCSRTWTGFVSSWTASTGRRTTRARRANGRRAPGCYTWTRTATKWWFSTRVPGTERGTFSGRWTRFSRIVGRARRRYSTSTISTTTAFSTATRFRDSRVARCPSPPPPTSGTSPPRSTWTETERCPSASSWTPSRNVATPNAIRRRRRRTRRRTRANTRRRWRRFANTRRGTTSTRGRCSRRATSTVVARWRRPNSRR